MSRACNVLAVWARVTSSCLGSRKPHTLERRTAGTRSREQEDWAGTEEDGEEEEREAELVVDMSARDELLDEPQGATVCCAHDGTEWSAGRLPSRLTV